MQPLVSILTPSYNYGRFLGDCLDSVSNQTYPRIEHVVVDGASSDNTVEILQTGRPGLRWISEPDRGQSHALNKALALSQGDIIGWINADDAYADRRAVAEAARVFEERPEVGAVYGHSLLINSANLVLQLMWSPPHWRPLVQRMTTFTQPSVFLRRSMLPEPFVREDLNFVMDRDLWLRLIDRTRFQRLDMVIAVDRQHSNRKVMGDAYQIERKNYNRKQAKAPLSPMLRKPLTVALRLGGLTKIPSLATSIEPAFGLRFDPVPEMAVRQALVPRRSMQIE